ncbi:cobalt-precorrin-6A reductase [Conexibacter sp. DBS9H8]|uniref:cobalt-precorrin-6A reductase n=1 Tax=Conexibacter sp. DBS9H8 TaxID=2937801 RepID=UPI00200E97E4|nr:cobalt-precorrin-6A reductase [Conexibacter sp. DBS9H8]
MLLILGGTAEARAFAEAVSSAELWHPRPVPRVISSLAGRVAAPRLPVGEVRIGGFGGIDGLAAWLADHRVGAVVDATHPFAQQISAHAAVACARTATPLLRLERPGWSDRPPSTGSAAAAEWTWVDSLTEAAAAIPPGARVFLTTGRQGLEAFASVERAWFLIRCVDPPETPLPPHHQLLLARGPYTLEGERALIDTHRLSVLITKDSGGSLTAAKLEAAAGRGVPVVIVRRPARPEVPTVTTVAAALRWVSRQPHMHTCL